MHPQQSSQVELCREYRFEAAHFLPKVPAGHRCARMHGHSYRFEVVLTGSIDPETGWVMDFYELDQAVAPILEELDHRMLNDIPGLQNSTCEILSQWIWNRLIDKLPLLRTVTVWETYDARCVYYGSRNRSSTL